MTGSISCILSIFLTIFLPELSTRAGGGPKPMASLPFYSQPLPTTATLSWFLVELHVKFTSKGLHVDVLINSTFTAWSFVQTFWNNWYILTEQLTAMSVIWWKTWYPQRPGCLLFLYIWLLLQLIDRPVPQFYLYYSIYHKNSKPKRLQLTAVIPTAISTSSLL